MTAKFTFVDLFAGIGGFHAALSSMGGECVYAVENDPKAAAVYETNWGINPMGDITDAANEHIVVVPNHDVLVAGFPCQPFSKAGRQRGMEETRGTLYWNILRIIEARRPSLVMLENVRNLAGPRHAHEWKVIIGTLREQGYKVASTPTVFSPHLLPPSHGGTPQNRERVFIVAVRCDDLRGDQLIDDDPILVNGPIGGWNPQDWDVVNDLPLLDQSEAIGYSLSETEVHWIDAWNDLVVAISDSVGRFPNHPIWGDSWVLLEDLHIPLGTPDWKSKLLRKNAEFYTENKDFLDNWVVQWEFYSDKFPASRRKLEWQAQDASSLWGTVMHFRPSGIRAKKATYLPALVAMNQTSIIGSQRRRITPREAARLQGLPDDFKFGDQPDSVTYKQLGNGVCVGAVSHVLMTAIDRYQEILSQSAPALVEIGMSLSRRLENARHDS
jgi:DNA (cytosine-5)-methyltransferase 1